VEGKFAGLTVGDSVVSKVVEILLLPDSFGGTFRETIFLVESYLLFAFLSFGSF
jgi:hypothetical protein